MKAILEEAKIKITHIQIPDETGSIPEAILEEGHSWLEAIYQHQFARCQETKRLLPEDQWNHYRQMDMEDTIEMTELRQRLRDLRGAIINKDRPVLFRRKTFNGKKKAAKDDARSPEEKSRNRSTAKKN